MDFNEMLSQLRQSPQAMPWAARRELVQHLVTALDKGTCSPPLLETVHLLASDPKWEIRNDVADLLLLLPEEHFAGVAAKLCDDTNSFVRRSTARALDRRRRGQRASRRMRQEFNRVQSQYATMEKLYGKAVAEKTRKLAQRFFDQMMAATVHEMRGILTPLMAGTSSLLLQLDDGRFDTAKFRAQLKKTAARLAFLERLVEDMRAYSQPPPDERRRERLLDLVQAAAAMVRENLEAQGRRTERVELSIDIPGGLVVEVSRHLMLVAIANVLKNAFEAFAAEGNLLRPGKIAVSAQLTGEDAVKIVIADNGMGICPEDLQEILDFLPGKTTKKSQGTGFGLPIAQRNLAAHGGSIGIDSEEDVGTTVTLILPIEQDKGAENDL